jgi:hypothetical protein
MDTYSNVLYVKVSSDTSRCEHPDYVRKAYGAERIRWMRQMTCYVQERRAELSHLAHSSMRLEKYSPETCVIVGKTHALFLFPLAIAFVVNE